MHTLATSYDILLVGLLFLYSIHEDKPIHTYDEITTFAARMTKDTSNTTSTTGKIEQGVKYEISATDISTSSNQAYGYLQREKP